MGYGPLFLSRNLATRSPAANNTASPSPVPAISSTTAANPRCVPQNQSPTYPPPADPPPHTGKRNVRTPAPPLPHTPAQSASLPPPSFSQSAPAAPPASPADKSPGPARECPPSAPRNTARKVSTPCHPNSNSQKSGPSPSGNRRSPDQAHPPPILPESVSAAPSGNTSAPAALPLASPHRTPPETDCPRNRKSAARAAAPPGSAPASSCPPAAALQSQ